MDVAWSRARLDEKYLIHGFRKFTLGDRYLPEGVLFVFKTPISKKKIQKHKILLCKKSLFSLHKQNKEIPYKKS